MTGDEFPNAGMSGPQTRVGFSYAKGVMGLFSRLIMFITREPCSHTWLVYFDADFDCDMVMEAHAEWRLIPLDVFVRKNHIVAIYSPKLSIDQGLRQVGILLGSRYDYEGLFGNLWVILGEWFKRKWRNPFRSNRMVFCSEGVARAMRAAGYYGLKGEVHSMRPGTILALLKQDGSVEWKR